MIGNLGGVHLIVLLAIVLLIFGAAKLPALARSVGQSTRIFKSEIRSIKDDDERTDGREGVTVDAANAASGRDAAGRTGAGAPSDSRRDIRHDPMP